MKDEKDPELQSENYKEKGNMNVKSTLVHSDPNPTLPSKKSVRFHSSVIPDPIGKVESATTAALLSDRPLKKSQSSKRAVRFKSSAGPDPVGKVETESTVFTSDSSTNFQSKEREVRTRQPSSISSRKFVSSLSNNIPTNSLMIRAPDIDDDLFEHEDIFTSSPYLDLKKSSRKRKVKSAFKKMYGALSGTKEQKQIECTAFVTVVLILITVSFLLFLPDEVNPVADPVEYTSAGLFRTVPTYLVSRLANWYVPDDEARDLPFFWSIPMSGGLLYSDIVGTCYHLVQASEAGVLNEASKLDDELRIVEIFGESFVNVDTTSKSGIERAIKLGFIESGYADIVFSPQITAASFLFNEKNQGRMFSIFRHPIQRSANMYYYFSTAKWDRRYNPNLQNITLDQFAVSNYMENNYMTRLLINKPGGGLSYIDVNNAKEILRQKSLIGLYDEMEETIKRFEKYFHWTDSSKEDLNECISRMITNGVRKYDLAPIVKEGTTTWDLMYKKNIYDVELYEFARSLFQFQEMQDIDFR